MLFLFWRSVQPSAFIRFAQESDVYKRCLVSEWAPLWLCSGNRVLVHNTPVIHCITDFLLLVLSLKLQSAAMSLPSYALSTGSESMNASNTTYKLLSLTYKVLTITQPPYLYNVISVQFSVSIRSSSIVTIARPPTSLIITDRSFQYASPCLWNLFISLSTLFWYQFLHFRLTYAFTHHFFLLFHHSAHP